MGHHSFACEPALEILNYWNLLASCRGITHFDAHTHPFLLFLSCLCAVLFQLNVGEFCVCVFFFISIVNMSLRDILHVFVYNIITIWFELYFRLWNLTNIHKIVTISFNECNNTCALNIYCIHLKLNMNVNGGALELCFNHHHYHHHQLWFISLPSFR